MSAFDMMNSSLSKLGIAAFSISLKDIEMFAKREFIVSQDEIKNNYKVKDISDDTNAISELVKSLSVPVLRANNGIVILLDSIKQLNKDNLFINNVHIYAQHGGVYDRMMSCLFNDNSSGNEYYDENMRAINEARKNKSSYVKLNLDNFDLYSVNKEFMTNVYISSDGALFIKEGSMPKVSMACKFEKGIDGIRLLGDVKDKIKNTKDRNEFVDSLNEAIKFIGDMQVHNVQISTAVSQFKSRRF